jgi:hypothetical protein
MRVSGTLKEECVVLCPVHRGPPLLSVQMTVRLAALRHEEDCGRGVALASRLGRSNLGVL